MLEIKRKIKPVKINDVLYNMKSPNYSDSMEYEAAVKNCGDDAEKKIECLFDYLEKLGLKKEISKDLEIENISDIISYLAGEKKS